MSLTQVRDVSVEDICKRTKPRKHYVSFFQRAIKPTGKEVVMKRLESEDFAYSLEFHFNQYFGQVTNQKKIPENQFIARN